MPTKTSQPKSKKSVAEARAKLAAGAKAIKASNGAKPAKARVVDDTIPAIEEVEADVKSIIKKCVILDGEHPGLTLNEKTTTGEYAKLFDYFTHQGESVQFIIGDLILAGEKLPGFKGKYTQAMLATGRSLDSLKAYRSVALHTPPELRLLGYTHTRETVKIEKLEDRKAVIEKFAEQVKQGKNPSVLEVRAAADKLAPRKQRGKKPVITIVPTRDATPEEEAVLKELEENGSEFMRHLEMSQFAFEIKDAQVSKLRDILKRISASYMRFVA